MHGIRMILLGALALACITPPCSAVIFLETADPSHHSSSPGDNSGWQFEGEFGDFLGVPISPYHFITARHIGGNIGDTFHFHGASHLTIGWQDVPSGLPPANPGDPAPPSDLRVWEIQHSTPFPNWAPLSSNLNPQGLLATAIGRGTQRGTTVTVSGEPRGWRWGPSDKVKRWGRNLITARISDSIGKVLYCDFDQPGIPGECHLSVGDSGGGLFIQEDGLWKLAGIHYAVDGPFRTPPAGPSFSAALFDCRDLEFSNGTGWQAVAPDPNPIPSSFYSSLIADKISWLTTHVGTQVTTLAPENYANWLPLYFSPAAIADPSTSGPLADPDSDGISNLEEFALHLDPSIAGRPLMEPSGAVSGLPTATLSVPPSAPGLTAQFVRRTSAGGSTVQYIPEFSSDLINWQPATPSTVTPINPRWERISVADPAPSSSPRFFRLRLILPP